MKIRIIGCTHAGTAAAVNAAKENPNAEIVVYERNDNISFLSCGIALYVGDFIKDVDGLFYSSPEALKDIGVEAKMEHDVLNIDIENKTLKVEDLSTGNIIDDSFDKLIVTTGSWPIQPPIENSKLENILLSKNFNHANTIIEKSKDAKNIVVVGAGYIGVELAESFERLGKNVTLVDAMNRIMNKYLDPEFTDVAEDEFRSNGVNLALGELVQKFEGENGKVTKVITNKNTYDADLVIMCIGFVPNTELVKDQIDTLENGAIKVNKYMQTSNKDVYAAGDSCAIYYNPTEEHRYIPLATNAIRMGTIVGKNLNENKLEYLGTQGTSGIKIYSSNFASTGLTEASAADVDVEYETVTAVDNNKPEFMPEHEEVTLKLLYKKDTKELLGAQIHSKADMTQYINTLSVAIQNKMTLNELAVVDFFFQPHYNKPWSIINIAAQKGL